MESLILHPGALGDIILALPAIKILREHFREARITLAANMDFATAIAAGYADRVDSLSSYPLHRLHSLDPPGDDDKAFWQRYDRILSWTGHASPRFAANLGRIHPVVIVAGWKPGSGDRIHVSQIFADSLRSWLPAAPVLAEPEVSVARSDRLQAAEWLRSQGWRAGEPVVAVHPGAGSVAKRWPLERFRELSARLQTRARLLIIEGPAEPDLGRRLQSMLDSAMPVRLPLRQLSAILSHCGLYVGNDSGVAHLSAALRVPTVALFGPTLPIHWAPRGEHVRVLRDSSGCAACITPAGAAAIHTCMDNLSVEDVEQNSLDCGALA